MHFKVVSSVSWETPSWGFDKNGITPPDHCEEQITLIVEFIGMAPSLFLYLSLTWFFLSLACKLSTYKLCVYFVRFTLRILFSLKCVYIFTFGAHLFIATLWEYNWFLLTCPETLINGLISSRVLWLLWHSLHGQFPNERSLSLPLNLRAFNVFSCFIALAWTLSTILSKTGESNHPFSTLGQTVFSLPGTFLMFLCKLSRVPSVLLLWAFF